MYYPFDLEKGIESDFKQYYIDRLTYDEDVVSIQDWHKDNYAVEVSLINNTDIIKQVEVPLLLYKSYRAISNSGERLQISPGTSYRISVAVPKGFNGSFRVEFKEPWYWRMCELLSFITLIGIVFYIKRNYFKKYSYIKCIAKEK